MHVSNVDTTNIDDLFMNDFVFEVIVNTLEIGNLFIFSYITGTQSQT